MKAFTFLLLAVVSFGMLSAQNIVIFQPDSGANDGTDQGGLNGGKDTWVNRNTPNDNYGNMNVVLASPRSNCNPSDYKSYYQFDVSGLPDVVDSVFFGVTHIAHDTYCYSNCNADFYFYYCGPWDEMTLHQYALPLETPTPFYGPINITFPNDFGTREYNITTAYNFWKDTNNVNFGFTVYSPTVGCNNAAVGFFTYSSDDTVAANRPYLKIYYPSQAGFAEETLPLDVFPNPFGDYIQVDLTQVDVYYVTDLTGRRISVDYNPATKRLETSTLASGMYLLFVERSGKHAVKKLVKR